LMVVPAPGAVVFGMLGVCVKAVRRWYACGWDLSRMAVADSRCGDSGGWFLVGRQVLRHCPTVLSHPQNAEPTSRLENQNIRYCLGLKGRRLQNYLMSPPRSCRTLVRLIDLNFQSAIGL
jgi:hypothetical protein